MDFVDGSSTPQSSANTTPVVPRETDGTPPAHMRNLRLGELPRSSPPIQPTRLRESRIDSTPEASLHNTPTFDPMKAGGTESRWEDPAYCQLLADVVQALSNPESRAAKVAKLYATTAVDTAVSAAKATPVPASTAAIPSATKLQQMAPPQIMATQVVPVPTFADLPAIGSLAVNTALPIFSADHGAIGHNTTPLLLPSATKSPAVTAVADELSVNGPMDQDLSMYMQFLQSLTSDHIDLGCAWSTLFEDTGGNTGSSAALLGIGTTAASTGSVLGQHQGDKLSSTKKAGGDRSAIIEDDDMDDGDFVLDEDDDGEYAGHASSAAGGLSRLDVGSVNAGKEQMASGSAPNNAWDLALNMLGLGTASTGAPVAPGMALPFAPLSAELDDGRSMFTPDPLIQQLMQGVANLGQSPGGAGGTGGTAGSGDEGTCDQSVWLPNAASGSTMLPQWHTADGVGLAAASAAASYGAPKASGKRPAVATTGKASKGAAQLQLQLQQQAPAEQMSARRGLLKAARKRHGAIGIGSSSYKRAMLAAEKAPAVAIDVDGLLGSEAGGMETEMSGLYQDALQEGEELDVQEESLMADNSEFLFLADQMAQLRAQQLMNFQLVVQAFLIACAELGPHAPRARHWRRQLDQLALWHSLGTRESPTDLVSAAGLARFAELIASAERLGAGGVGESGRFAPNPASFFAIPGITAIIPDIYEAVDEIHRAAHVAPDADAGGAEVRSLNSAMEFTPRCQCTAVRRFKSAIVLECVFPRLHLQIRNGKRKAEAEAEVKVVGKRKGTAAAKTNDADAGLAPPPPPISRQGAGGKAGGGQLPALMPQVVSEILPSCTQADLRAVIEEMRVHMRTFKRDVHRVPRFRRRVFVQGDDGVPRLEWIRVSIQPLGLPPAMQCVMAPLLAHCGFQDALLPRIVVVRKPKNRIHFLDSEDSLLLLGLRLFGLEDVASVRVHLMPCKTASQLRNRMNNLRARRAPPNPVKDFCLRRIAPFTLEEEEILRVGVMVYGDEFRRVNTSQNLLVNRPILALSHVWNHVRKNPDS
ncbi:hypothetical protein GGI04_001370 [Coemansia thaxteri]|nr:hypothetical protein GGI04_001370 [Coemansia thaxteri]